MALRHSSRGFRWGLALWCFARIAQAAAPPEQLAETRLAGEVRTLLERLSLEEKVGQLLMVGFGGLEVDATIEELVRGRKVGGVCLFKRNIEGADQVARLNEEVRRLLEGHIPPFIAVDQEGGNVVRISDRTVVLPGNMALGATRSGELAYEAGRTQGEDLRLLGFNMNFAPVLDVNLNPKNPVIGIRSFADAPALVSQLGRDFVRGQQEANIATVAKHFPGHGSTDADSHRALPVMNEPVEEVLAQMAPFRDVISHGLDGLMTAHVAIPTLTGDELPATLSAKVLTGLLREKLQFDGMVITDELEMDAIAHRYGVGRAAVMAISAGADMVLIPWRAEKKTEVYQALLAAARDGSLSAARLDDAVRRILTVKKRRGVFEPQGSVDERLLRFGGQGRAGVADKISQGSVTLLRHDPRHFPLRAGKKLAVITAEAGLARALRRRYPDLQALVVPSYPRQELRARHRALSRKLALAADVVVVGLVNSRQLDLVTIAAGTGKPVLVVSMGLPYYAEQATEARAVLAVYSYRKSAAEAAAAALAGEEGTPGKLPVTLRSFPFGHGLDPVGEAVARKAAAALRARTASPD